VNRISEETLQIHKDNLDLKYEWDRAKKIEVPVPLLKEFGTQYGTIIAILIDLVLQKAILTERCNIPIATSVTERVRRLAGDIHPMMVKRAIDKFIEKGYAKRIGKPRSDYMLKLNVKKIAKLLDLKTVSDDFIFDTIYDYNPKYSQKFRVVPSPLKERVRDDFFLKNINSKNFRKKL
jgi:hypothetical protein